MSKSKIEKTNHLVAYMLIKEVYKLLKKSYQTHYKSLE